MLKKLAKIQIVLTSVAFLLLLLAQPYLLINAHEDDDFNPDINNPMHYGIGGSDEQRLKEIQQKLAELNRQKAGLQSAINANKNKQSSYQQQISLISNEKNLLESEIEEKQLMIEELGIQIDILKKSIKDTEKVIEKTQEEIEELNIKADQQLSDMYLDIKTYNTGLNLIFTDGGSSSFIKNGLYQRSIQEDTNNSLKQLNEKNEKLQEDQKQLEEDKASVESDKKKVDSEKAELDKKEGELQAKVNGFRSLISQAQNSINANLNLENSLSQKEQQLLAEQELLKQRLFKSVGSIPNGQKVLKGTVIGVEGNTGVSTGAHLHFGVAINGSLVNPCSVLPKKQLANASCGVSNPKVPSWPITGTPYLTSGFRTSSRPTHDAIDVSNGGGSLIYAAHDGYVTYGNDGACSWYRGVYPCNGAGAKYAIICENKANCSQGLKTMYWHLK